MPIRARTAKNKISYSKDLGSDRRYLAKPVVGLGDYSCQLAGNDTSQEVSLPAAS